MNRSKLALTGGSLILLVGSLWFYAHQQENPASNSIGSGQPKAKLNGYELYRYQNNELKTRVAGSKATLLEPAKLFCENRVKAVRIRDGVREELESQTAIVTFVGDSLMSKKDAAIDTVELTGGVDFIRSNSHFRTESLTYTEKTGDAITDKPVRIDSDIQFIAAEGGMTYNVRAESIHLRGGVVGSVRTDAMENSLGTKKSK